MDATAARGFASVADAYQRARPGWPPDAIDAAFERWGLRPEAGLVLDVAAGTGRLTELLATRCPRLLAVEPLPEMRAHIAAAPAVEGTAEGLPVEDQSVHAIFTAEAFHWFDRAAALDEFARALVPGGGVAVMWNTPRADPVAEWQAALTKLFAELPENLRPRTPGARTPPGMSSVAANYRDPADDAWRTGPEWAAFEPVQRLEFGHSQTLDRDGVVDLVSSWSFIGAMEAAARAELLERIRATLAAEGMDSMELDWRTDVYLTRRRA